MDQILSLGNSLQEVMDHRDHFIFPKKSKKSHHQHGIALYTILLNGIKHEDIGLKHF